ncbi:hypothetical protein RDI58_016135 [Solanum bulbocastanum]|uniref:BED-type domain-containing protein n=1 Tax=Solanum bulbocastanum TaxID=147425 RepID=A0AAN8TGW4_SOLBU
MFHVNKLKFQKLEARALDCSRLDFESYSSQFSLLLHRPTRLSGLKFSVAHYSLLTPHNSFKASTPSKYLILSLFLCQSNFIMSRLHGSNTRSPIWNHYEKLEEKEDGSWTVKCVHCGRVTYYHSHKTGTTSLRKNVKQSWVKATGRGLKVVVVVLTVENLKIMYFTQNSGEATDHYHFLATPTKQPAKPSPAKSH